LVKPADKKQKKRDANTQGKKFNMVLKGVQTKIVTQTRSVVGKHKKNRKGKDS